MPIFNYHEYKLIDQPPGSAPVKLFHVIALRQRPQRNGWQPSSSGPRDFEAPLTTPTPGPTVAHSGAVVSLQLPAVGGTGLDKQQTFLSFAKNRTPIGRVCALEAGGIQLESIGGDIAEWHHVADAEKNLPAEADLVALRNGQVTPTLPADMPGSYPTKR